MMGQPCPGRGEESASTYASQRTVPVHLLRREPVDAPTVPTAGAATCTSRAVEVLRRRCVILDSPASRPEVSMFKARRTSRLTLKVRLARTRSERCAKPAQASQSGCIAILAHRRSVTSPVISSAALRAAPGRKLSCEVLPLQDSALGACATDTLRDGERRPTTQRLSRNVMIQIGRLPAAAPARHFGGEPFAAVSSEFAQPRICVYATLRRDTAGEERNMRISGARRALPSWAA